MFPFVSPKSGRRVLVVEDDRMIAELVKIRVELAGHQTFLAGDASKAVEAISSFRPHCIVLDIGLPGKNGLDLLRYLRSTTATRFIPVMILTARSATSDVRAAVALGAEDYVTKPFDDKNLIRRVGRLLDPALRMPVTAVKSAAWV